MHAYESPSFLASEKRRLKKTLLMNKKLPVPNDPVIGRGAVLFLCSLALLIAVAGVVARFM